MEVVQPLNLSDKVSFSTSMSGSYPIFFNSFIASTPRHPVLKAALASFYQYYVNRTGFCRQTGEGFENVVGCCTLWDGYQATSVQDRGETFIMQEEHLQHGKYPNLPKRGYKDPDCDFVVHHDASHQVYFYSRIVGSGHCQKRRRDVCAVGNSFEHIRDRYCGNTGMTIVSLPCCAKLGILNDLEKLY